MVGFDLCDNQPPDARGATRGRIRLDNGPTQTHVVGGDIELRRLERDCGFQNTIDAIAFGFNARSTDSGFSGECTVVDQSTAPKTMTDTTTSPDLGLIIGVVLGVLVSLWR